MRVSRSFVVAVALAVGLSACAKKKPETPPPGPAPAPATTPTRPDTPPPPPPPPAAATPAAPTEEELFARSTLEELNKNLSDVYFAYDSVEIDEAGRASIQKNLQWLNRWKTTKIKIEGHADSRGTNEYNLALAERRADAVRDYLISLGLTADRVTVVSMGEEQPACTDEIEDCWRQNRRGRFVLTAK